VDREFKQVIVVRSDLKMGKGKTAAQVAHAAVMGSERTKRVNRDWYDGWHSSGQAKVVLKVDSLESLLSLIQRSEREDLPTSLVEDRGLTQIPAGTVTCLAIGPGPSLKIDKITSDLKLL